MTDIFDYGFDKSLNKPIDGNATGVVYDSVDQQNTGSIVQGGNLVLKTLSIGGLVRQVAPGDDIQAAIDAINREGGGTVQLLAKTYTLNKTIDLRSNVALVGSSVQSTILDLNNQSIIIRALGGLTAPLSNIRVADLTIKNSSSGSGGLDFQFSDNFRIENVIVDNCSGSGFRIDRCQEWIMVNCSATSNSTGFTIVSTTNRDTKNFTLINCSSSGGTTGFSVVVGTNDMFFGNFVGCRASSNTGDGFDFSASGSSALDTTLTSCVASTNSGIGFDVNTLCQRISFINCFADANTGDGFEIDGIDNLLVGCNSQDPIDINTAVVIVGNHLLQSGAPTTDLSITESDTISYLNQGESPRTIRRLMQMQNGSGSALRTGDVVIFASDADGETVTTTTTAGDDKVFGVVDESIASTSYGRIHVEGYSTLVKVSNLAASIAVGDFLSTFSAAYYAQKASSGQMAFAIALEAPTTGTAQVDALLISPRQIQ